MGNAESAREKKSHFRCRHDATIHYTGMPLQRWTTHPYGENGGGRAEVAEVVLQKLSDGQLPGANGSELLKRIKRNPQQPGPGDRHSQTLNCLG
jgi:CheY-like chemotaxis protein